MQIRKATVDDVPVLMKLLTAMVGEAGEQPGSTEKTLRTHGFGPVPRFHALLAEQATRAVGMILYFAEYSTWRGEMGLFVQDIYVGPDARGLGLGRALLAAALREADWSPKFLTLMVARKNGTALAFYAGLGMGLRNETDQLILEGAALAALLRP